MIVYLACVALLLIGIYCLAVKKNLIKMIIGLAIMEYAVNLFLVVLGYRPEGVDPVPQALALTVIAVGLATTVIMAAIAMRIHDRYGTFDVTKIRKLRG